MFAPESTIIASGFKNLRAQSRNPRPSYLPYTIQRWVGLVRSSFQQTPAAVLTQQLPSAESLFPNIRSQIPSLRGKSTGCMRVTGNGSATIFINTSLKLQLL